MLLLLARHKAGIALWVEPTLAGWPRPLKTRGQSCLALVQEPVLPEGEGQMVNTRHRRTSLV